MKQIKKQVLTEQTVFVAEDGTEFKDEHQCLNYEIKLQAKKEKADFLEKFGIVDLSEEHLLVSDIDEDIYLCHMENENDVILLAHAFKEIGMVDDEKYFIDSVETEMKYGKLSFPLNFAVTNYIGDFNVYHGWLDQYIVGVNKIKNKIDDFMAKNGGK